MTDANNLVLEQLRAIREVLDRHSDALAGLRVEIAAMGQQLGALTTAVYAGHDRTRELERRVERLERRLELTDSS